jgi:DNA-binding NarL/FixJ family response regulator
MNMRILLVEDHRIVRDGLRACLEKEKDMQVVAEAKDGRSAVELAEQHSPGIVVMDVGLPVLNGIEATRQIVSKVPGAKVVALSAHSEKRFVKEMLNAGARGYLIKESAFDELARAIRLVASGRIFLGKGVSGLQENERTDIPARDKSSAYAVLTSRERQVLQLLAEGRTTKAIAADLELSVKTIETHRMHIMKKLDIKSVAALTKYAIREGLTSLD